jgi:hypothetical protein
MILLVAVVVIAGLVVGVLLFRSSNQGASLGTAEEGYSWEVTSGASSDDLHQMEKAVAIVMTDRSPSVPSGQQVRFEGVRLAGEWAVTEPVTRDAASGALVGGEASPILLRKVDGTWRAAYPGTVEFNSWLAEAPDDLIAPETKQLLR